MQGARSVERKAPEQYLPDMVPFADQGNHAQRPQRARPGRKRYRVDSIDADYAKSSPQAFPFNPPKDNTLDPYVLMFKPILLPIFNRLVQGYKGVLIQRDKAASSLAKVEMLQQKGIIPKSLRISNKISLPDSQRSFTDRIKQSYERAEKEALACLVEARKAERDAADEALIRARVAAVQEIKETLLLVDYRPPLPNPADRPVAREDNPVFISLNKYYVGEYDSAVMVVKFRQSLFLKKVQAAAEAKEKKRIEQQEAMVEDPEPAVQQLVNKAWDRIASKIKGKGSARERVKPSGKPVIPSGKRGQPGGKLVNPRPNPPKKALRWRKANRPLKDFRKGGPSQVKRKPTKYKTVVRTRKAAHTNAQRRAAGGHIPRHQASKN